MGSLKIAERGQLKDRQVLADAEHQPVVGAGAVDQRGVAAAEPPEQPVRQEPAGGAGVFAVILGDVVEADLMPVQNLIPVRGLWKV